MLNAKYKKEALSEYEKVGNTYRNTYELTLNNITKLHVQKEKSVKILKDFERYICSLTNRPKEIEKTFAEINIRRKEFENEINTLRLENKKSEKISTGAASAGVVTGVGVAAFGPSVAMAVATTFGTASTGTAIATLSGAAATNAALAWLGGGALAVGGGGIAAGNAFLAMAGPVGWAIGGVAIVGGSLGINHQNKKTAQQALKKTEELKDELQKVLQIDKKVQLEQKAINSMNRNIKAVLENIKNLKYQDYKKFSLEEKKLLMDLMNASEALAKRIGEKIQW